MNAIITTGGKQYHITENSEIYIEKIEGEAGDSVEFDQVLLVGDKVGKPLVDGAKVTGEIVKQGKSKKIVIYKYRPKKDSSTKQGHRQRYTKVKITAIN